MGRLILPLIARDGPDCHLCGVAIDDLTQASADHVQPRVFGGSDGITNRLLAHLDCDNLRGFMTVEVARGLIRQLHAGSLSKRAFIEARRREYERLRATPTPTSSYVPIATGLPSA